MKPFQKKKNYQHLLRFHLMLNLFKRGNRTSTPSLFSSDVFPPAAPPPPPFNKIILYQYFNLLKYHQKMYFQLFHNLFKPPTFFQVMYFLLLHPHFNKIILYQYFNLPPIRSPGSLIPFFQVMYFQLFHNLFHNLFFKNLINQFFQNHQIMIFQLWINFFQQISKNWITCIPD